MSKKQRREVNRKKREEKQLETKEKGSPRAIASALIMSIESGYITYRQFKEIQEIIDEKYWHPRWAQPRQPNG